MPDRPRPITFFHVLWLTGVLLSGWFGYSLVAQRGILLRIGVVLLSAVVGFFVSHLAIYLFVTGILIPRLDPRSYWSYEVDCYMRQVIGPRWDGDNDRT